MKTLIVPSPFNAVRGAHVHKLILLDPRVTFTLARFESTYFLYRRTNEIRTDIEAFFELPGFAPEGIYVSRKDDEGWESVQSAAERLPQCFVYIPKNQPHHMLILRHTARNYLKVLLHSLRSKRNARTVAKSTKPLPPQDARE